MILEIPNAIQSALQAADGFLFTAGAGMGVDSGLPDFRGNEGFWKAYPVFKEAGVSFVEAANPQTFAINPEMAWGFYGHRLNLYRQTQPHTGFALLKQLGEKAPQSYFVFTSNVDGQFQKAGFDTDRIAECHGSIHHLQCSHNCSNNIWSAADVQLSADQHTCLAKQPLPVCPDCGGLARPNILMFGDYHWEAYRTEQQQQKLSHWLSKIKNLVVIECGAGTHVPTVRHVSERVGGTLIRINPRDSDLNGATGISLKTGAKAGIQALFEAVN